MARPPLQEIASLRRQAEAFNNPSTYVKCAKFQRLANAKEKELAALQQHRDIGMQDKVDAVVSTLKVCTGAQDQTPAAAPASRL
jgi:hypothetical protein